MTNDNYLITVKNPHKKANFLYEGLTVDKAGYEYWLENSEIDEHGMQCMNIWKYISYQISSIFQSFNKRQIGASKG